MASFSCTLGEMTTETAVELPARPNDSEHAEVLDETEPGISVGHW